MAMSASKEEIKITLGHMITHPTGNSLFLEKSYLRIRSGGNVKGGTASNESYYKEIHATQDSCLRQLKITI